MEDSKKELYDFFEEYLLALRGMVDAEEQKLDALFSNKGDDITRAMNLSQANAMQVENIEKKREELQSEAGLGGYTFSQIIDDAEKQYKPRLAEIFKEASNLINQIKYLNTRSMRIADSNLRLMGIKPDAYIAETVPFDEHKPKEPMSVINAKKGYNVK